ncbi:ester cyclase [Pseudomonas typographi]|uniref:Ester cyclase n=1 Tax=Pseudomonas typographi TaxID=2715964 RepID=A0ABR7Z5C0_9PSED|nr:ester cyclase [Pseudomonas typographi]MBD1552838.1 ester cyclase [Pseudomonas typographi]MBD1586942.1 ester cyclase [Pseudomonas typographi]MBD1600599.1 ester cyclase [Pseudomonas typographi]
MSKTNKALVCRFNEEVIEQCNRAAFDALVADDFINRTTAPGTPDGKESLWHTFNHVLRPGLADLKVTVLDQVAEGDKVTTRKRITAIHVGELLGIAATGRSVVIDVIDIVRIHNSQYVEHWGINSLSGTLAALRSD